MYTDYAEDTNSKNPFYIGTVVDNKDPTHNYRVKVRLPVLHKKIPDNKLPWAARVDRAFRGMFSDTPKTEEPSKEDSSDTSNKNTENKKDESKESKKKTPPKFDHCVPEVGTKVLLLAIQNDVNSLIYLGNLYKKTKYTPEKDDKKYLDTYGVYGEDDQFIGIDATGKEDNEIKVHFIGHVDVDKVKKITVNAKQEITVTGKKDIRIEILDADDSDSNKNKNENDSGEVNVTIINNRGTVKVQSKKLVAEVKEDAIIKSKTLTATVEEKAELTCKELDCNATEKAIIKTQDLTCNADKNLTVTCPNIKLNGSVEINGKTKINGNLKVSGNIDSDNSINAKTGVNAGNIPLGAHSHTYYTDGSPASTVNTFPTPS